MSDATEFELSQSQLQSIFDSGRLEIPSSHRKQIGGIIEHQYESYHFNSSRYARFMTDSDKMKILHDLKSALDRAYSQPAIHQTLMQGWTNIVVDGSSCAALNNLRVSVDFCLEHPIARFGMTKGNNDKRPALKQLIISLANIWRNWIGKNISKGSRFASFAVQCIIEFDIVEDDSDSLKRLVRTTIKSAHESDSGYFYQYPGEVGILVGPPEGFVPPYSRMNDN